jgi:hypothetical protein
MKILIKYKHGYYASLRKLKLLTNENVCLQEIGQGESIELEINEEHKFIYGKMDWAYTNKINISDINEEDYIEISNIFTFNPLRYFGIGNLPIIFAVKKQLVNLHGMTKVELEAYGRKLGIELDRRKNESTLIKEIKALNSHWK